MRGSDEKRKPTGPFALSRFRTRERGSDEKRKPTGPFALSRFRTRETEPEVLPAVIPPPIDVPKHCICEAKIASFQRTMEAAHLPAMAAEWECPRCGKMRIVIDNREEKRKEIEGPKEEKYVRDPFRAFGRDPY